MPMGYSDGGSILPHVIVIGIVLVLLFLFRKKTTTALVLTRFEVDPSEGKVLISGRPGGVLDWLLSLAGIASVTTLSATRDKVSFCSASLWGEHNNHAIMRSVSSLYCGLERPFGVLILGCGFFVESIVVVFTNNSAQGMLILWLLTAACVAYYSLSKSIKIGYETQGGLVLGLRFKRSVIENIPVDLNRARAAMAVMTALLTCEKDASVVDTYGQAPTGKSAAAARLRCPKCHVEYNDEMKGQYCEKCGAVVL